MTAQDDNFANAKFNMQKWQKGGLTSFEETCFAEYWDSLPPLFDSISGGNVVTVKNKIDPYNFYHRMALGKYLIQHTGGENVWGKGCYKHWFFAYLAQMDWQWRSGRFNPPNSTTSSLDGVVEDTTSKHGSTMDPNSWWARMNLGFSVGVYCGAAKAGQVPPIQFETTQVVKNPNEDPCFVAIVDNWCAFFKGPHEQFVQEQMANNTLQHDATAVFGLHNELWSYHSMCIEKGKEASKSLESKSPDMEMGLGWCNMVSLLEAMGWTNLSLETLMEDGIGYLPTLRIDGPTTIQWLQENRPREFETFQNLVKLYHAPPQTLQTIAAFWKRISYYTFMRMAMPKILNQLSTGTVGTKLHLVTKLIVLALLPHSMQEVAMWLSVGIGIPALVVHVLQ